MGRVIGGRAVGNNPPTLGIVWAEMTEFKFRLVEVTHGALLIFISGLAGQADTSLPVRVLLEKLGVEINHSLYVHRSPDLQVLSGFSSWPGNDFLLSRHNSG